MIEDEAILNIFHSDVFPKVLLNLSIRYYFPNCSYSKTIGWEIIFPYFLVTCPQSTVSSASFGGKLCKMMSRSQGPWHILNSERMCFLIIPDNGPVSSKGVNEVGRGSISCLLEGDPSPTTLEMFSSYFSLVFAIKASLSSFTWRKGESCIANLSCIWLPAGREAHLPHPSGFFNWISRIKCLGSPGNERRRSVPGKACSEGIILPEENGLPSTWA